MIDPRPDAGNDSGTGCRLRFPATEADVRIALAEVCARLAPALSDDAISRTELVLAEVLNNVAEHAYAGTVPGEIRLIAEIGDDGIAIVISDDGCAMPGGRPPEGRLPRIEDMDLADLPEGGFGWHLIHRLTEGLTYRRIGATNRISFHIPA